MCRGSSRQIGLFTGVTRAGFEAGTLAPEHYSRPHRRELVFDVEITDYEFLDLGLDGRRSHGLNQG